MKQGHPYIPQTLRGCPCLQGQSTTWAGRRRYADQPHRSRRYLVDAYAAATAFANLATSLSCTNKPRAESISPFQALLATTPWVSEPTTLVLELVHSASAAAR